MTKKQKKERASKERGDWGTISPLTKIIPNKKKVTRRAKHRHQDDA